MQIILMRHGDAEPASETVSNRNRRLTAHGVRCVEKSATLLKDIVGTTPLTIWSSPFKRTKQTAEIVAKTCNSRGIQLTNNLLQGSWQLTSAQLIKEGNPILIVSHQPFVQSYLLTIASVAMTFETAAIAVITYDVAWRNGKLVAYVTPECTIHNA